MLISEMCIFESALEVTSAARLYRAASVWTAMLNVPKLLTFICHFFQCPTLAQHPIIDIDTAT
jgi:hypothetical protein